MQFVFQPLTWGFLLILVPLAIHLINLLRHRRQHWAAMEFLMESYRKHRRWVWLKQFLLLLSRMAVMALLVAMLAQWVSGSRWLALLGERVTHHYILLDDSLSMADTVQGRSCYQLALQSINGILRSAAEDQGTHQLTLIRYSHAAPFAFSKPGPTLSNSAKHAPAAADKSTDTQVLSDVAADILARTVPSDPTGILERLNATMPTSLDVSCEGAIDLIKPLISKSRSERSIVYLVSDFRRKDWARPEAIRTALQGVVGDKNETDIQLIDCAQTQHDNLSLVSIEPEQEILAAGVPVFVNVQVRNQGASPARNVSVRIRTVAYGEATQEPKSNQSYSGRVQELPSILIDQIAPEEVVSRRVQVLFQQSGSQVFEATLPEDALLGDNRGTAVLEVRDGQPILLIDGDPRQRHAFFLDAVLNPGSVSKTGVLITRKGPEFLRDSDAAALSPFASIVLMSVGQMDVRALTHLEDYVRGGGGLAIYFGEDLTANDYKWYRDQVYRAGEGLLPIPLIGPATLAAASTDQGPDIVAMSHPIFQPLLGLSNSPFQLVRVSRFIATDRSNIEAARKESMRIVARLRDGSPLMIDHVFGRGRVVAVLTAIDPRWTNWPQDPTFVIASLKMMGYLGSFRLKDVSSLVGTPISIEQSAREYLPTFEVLLPSNTGNARLQMNLIAKENEQNQWVTDLRIDLTSQSEEITRAILTPGIFEVWGSRLQGSREIQAVAHNVSSIEGDLSKWSASDLAQGLRPLVVKYRAAEAITSSTLAPGLANRNGLLMLLLIGLLLVEQFLAWSASYHLPRRTAGGYA